MSRMQDTGCRSKRLHAKSARLDYETRKEIQDRKIVHRASCIMHHDKNGFTLIEIVMIIVIVSIAIPALLIVLGQETRQSVDAELQVSATNVGQAMMEEIKTKRWDETVTPPPYSDLTVVDPGETAGDPTTYDDVDDYAGGVPDISVGGVNYTRSVQVCYVQPGDLNNTSPCVTTPPSSPSSPDYKRIKVTVTNASLGSVELVTLVGNY